MSCQICGRSSGPGAKLCPDCRAARKRAYDATITQPLLALAGAGTVSRTLSRLRRSDNSPEAKARRAARKAKAAADAEPLAAATQAAATRYRFSRSILWAVLAIGVVIAAIAGWHLPTRAPETPDPGATTSAIPAPFPAPATDEPARINSPASLPAQLPPLPAIVERELVPHAPAAVKPATPKRVTAAPKVVTPPPEAPAEVEIVKAQPAPAPPAPQPPVRVDPWQQMSQAIGRCPAEFLGRVVCEQKVRLQYCEGQWGNVPQCPGGPSVDHN
jgi:hypothetical protein